MVDTLLSTKLHLPSVRAELVSRPRLLERLDASRHVRLTLVSAPAGYGKTTLLGEWIAGLDWPAVWFSLDREDNDVALFLAYLVAALRTLDEGVDEVVPYSFQSPQQPSPAARAGF